MVKNPPTSAGVVGSILGSERSPGEENGNPLQYSCLGNLIDRGAWWATVHWGFKELHTQMHTYENFLLALLCIFLGLKKIVRNTALHSIHLLEEV